MAFDSLGLFCALALFAASIGAWLLSAPLPARARLYLRFAAMLFAGLAVSFPLGLSGAVSLFLLPLAAAALMIASLTRMPVFAVSVVLISGLGFGLAALLSGMAVLALLPAVAAGLVIIAAGLNRGMLLAALAGAALLIGALASWNENALAGMFLFCAASLLGLARGRENQLLRSTSSALRG
jgi:hypothetical protein